MLFVAVHASVVGTKRTSRSGLMMSVIQGQSGSGRTAVEMTRMTRSRHSDRGVPPRNTVWIIVPTNGDYLFAPILCLA